MKEGESVTKKNLEAAAGFVQGELEKYGLWNEGSRLPLTDVVWCGLPQIHMFDAGGFFVEDVSRLGGVSGYEAGNIYIPKWILSHLRTQNRGSLRDILRHEYGHALAFHYPRLIRQSRPFENAYGAKYSGKPILNANRKNFVSDYAHEEGPAEDFAETFMYFIKYKGVIQPHFSSSPIVKKKWAFIRRLNHKIDEGCLVWEW